MEHGTRWGDRQEIRVVFAPHADQVGGYLYAHDTAADRVLLLSAQTTSQAVATACRELESYSSAADAYLALASLDLEPDAMTVDRANRLWRHCVEGEMDAYQNLTRTRVDEPSRFDVARSVVVQRAARVAAEDLLLESVRAHSVDQEAVIVRYRMIDDSGWMGRVPASSIEAAAAQTRSLVELADSHGLTAQATSVSHGATIVSAARVAELGLAAASPSRAVDVPGPLI